MSKKVIIVGGVAGGASCAARLRRLDEAAEIILLERGNAVSFANCGLPYHISGCIAKRDALILQTPESLHSRFNLDVRLQATVTAIDRAGKRVHVTDGQTGKTYTETYDVLVLSPGAEPVAPPIQGLDGAQRVHRLRTLADMDAIIADLPDAKHATVIGGGFIGLEVAENLRERGLEVALVEGAAQVLAPLDPEVAAPLHTELVSQGIDLRLNTQVTAFADDGKRITLADGSDLHTDFAVLAIGVRPETDLAKAAGLTLGARDAILVNDQLQTSDPAIYAIGDAIQVKDFVLGYDTLVPLAGPANRQGKLAADHICGRPVRYQGTLGTSVLKCFRLTAASCGNNEKTLQRLDLPYQALHLYPSDHAGYYPNANALLLKVLYRPSDGALYGAQCVGFSEVHKTIDTLATAIYGGLSVYDLADLELCYAPPYSTAKSPVNFAGYVAQNVRDGFAIRPATCLDDLAASDAYILDVRTPAEYKAGHLPEAAFIPLDDLRDRLDELPTDRTIYIHCAVGLRGYYAARLLTQKGYDVVNLGGGFRLYKSVKDQLKAKPLPAPPATATPAPAAAAPAEAPAAESDIDVTGLQCPGPVVEVARRLSQAPAGSRWRIIAPAGQADEIRRACTPLADRLTEEAGDGTTIFHLTLGAQETSAPKGLSLILYTADPQKIAAALTLAANTRSRGIPVDAVFAFWGLRALAKLPDAAPFVPRSELSRRLSQAADFLNRFHLDKADQLANRLRRTAGERGRDALDQALTQAQASGVNLLACGLSMEAFALSSGDLIDSARRIDLPGYLQRDKRHTTLFI